MGFLEDIIFWPFAVAFKGATIILAGLIIAFWLWMLIDCAKRRFKKDSEKIIWLIIIVLTSWLGSLIYFIVIKLYNQKGLTK